MDPLSQATSVFVVELHIKDHIHVNIEQKFTELQCEGVDIVISIYEQWSITPFLALKRINMCYIEIRFSFKYLMDL